jgi:ribosomal protein S18 acetylase RimI-like enzyme
MPAWTLRTAEVGDTDFLYRVYASTRADEMVSTGWSGTQQRAFLQSQFQAQDRHYRAHFPTARFDIVQVAGCDAGRLYVDRDKAHMRVLDIALLPEHRGRGLGSAMLRALLAEAGKAMHDVTLHVERHNRAYALYCRLGFAVEADLNLYLQMCWHAPQNRSDGPIRTPHSFDCQLETLP